ncbi:MAG: hypothetical protein IT532_18380 [Burkholderiales bacterium]|nr:hypothetical protein [Burkholderiales bacterium]
MHDAPFASAAVEMRVRALLDSACVPIERHGALLVAEGEAAGRRVAIASNDVARQRGAIGVEEAQALARLLARARGDGRPVVLLLDSSGARVDEGLPALGAFRALFREALRARLAGVRMFALLGAVCFGGASLLASLCAKRSYLAATLLAASGPRVIQAAHHDEHFDASDARAVHALLGPAARMTWHDQDLERTDTLQAARAAVHDWIMACSEGPPDLRLEHADLERRLLQSASAGLASSALAPALLEALLPPGYAPVFSGRSVRAEAGPGKPVFVGVLGGAPVDAGDSLRAAAMLLQAGTSHPGSALVLLLDASAHSASVRDERLLLSDYLVHLSLVIASLAHAGHRVALWIVGQASGASYIAFAAAADSVSAAIDARIEILPPAARAAIVGSRGTGGAGCDWLAAGVADALLEERLRLNLVQPSGPVT